MKLYIVLMFSQAALSLLEFFNAVNSVNMPNWCVLNDNIDVLFRRAAEEHVRNTFL